MKKLLGILVLGLLWCNISYSGTLTWNSHVSSSFTGVNCEYSYKTDYFSLGYTNCSYRCDNYVNGVSTKLPNSNNYAYYINSKVWGGQSCPMRP